MKQVKESKFRQLEGRLHQEKLRVAKADKAFHSLWVTEL